MLTILFPTSTGGEQLVIVLRHLVCLGGFFVAVVSHGLESYLVEGK